VLTKQQIIEEIKRTAKENGGMPLGMGRFEKQTGIKIYDWQKYWARFGDAQQEAGFIPNKLQSALNTDFMMGKIISLTRKMGKIPTSTEFRIEKNNDPNFPSKNTIQKLGDRQKLAEKIIEYCQSKNGYEDIIKLCKAVSEKTNKKENSDDGSKEILGSVYLFKSGKYYKIGKTNDTVRRGTELKIQLPEDIDLIHSIKTDDPSGIEAYWHKRFGSKRMNGEWFDLNSSDIKAFKHWRRIY